MTIEDEELPNCDQCREFYSKYEPRDVLGRGISSTVRRCIEKSSGREYAAKIFDVSGERTPQPEAVELREATKREINVLQLCSGHENIIELHDAFESSTYIFLVFEICEKGELFDYLTEVVTLSEKQTRKFMWQLLSALDYIHDKRICHRDLKPENVLLNANNVVKLSDFGFAHVLEENEELYDLCGTPGYLAPETLAVSMYEDAPGYGLEVDLWACGVIMYTLLVGCPPFWHRKQMYMLRMIMSGQYQFSSPEWDDISDNAKDLVSKFLIVDRTERISAKNALIHPFFNQHVPFVIPSKQKVNKFKVAFLVIRTIFRMWFLYKNPPPRSLNMLKQDPYRIKEFRRYIDASAFLVYNHWVKRGEDQNRAALFQNKLKAEIVNA